MYAVANIMSPAGIAASMTQRSLLIATITAAASQSAKQDINGDGRLDLMVHFPQELLGLTAPSTQLCVSGTLPDQTTFTSCDPVRVQ